jgi:hypothetical protein
MDLILGALAGHRQRVAWKELFNSRPHRLFALSWTSRDTIALWRLSSIPWRKPKIAGSRAGYALRIATDMVPDMLYTISITNLDTGTSVRALASIFHACCLSWHGVDGGRV